MNLNIHTEGVKNIVQESVLDYNLIPTEHLKYSHPSPPN